MALVTLQTIFQDALPAYEQSHPLPAYVRKAARALRQCRTAALGGHIHACPDGHMSRIWYNSCRQRSCPLCASLQTERWLALQQVRLLACDPFPGLFTLPHDLHPLWQANVPVMTTLLLQAVRDTLSPLLADPKYLGAQPGIMAALHTWSQPLVLHPHLPGLVTGGGRPSAGQWGAVRHGFLLPARVVTSLARSLRGGPIKNARLVAWDGACVTFLHRARHEEAAGDSPSPQRLTLAVADFLQRWLQPVPAPQTRVVRYDGLYHHPHTEALALCRTHLGQRPVAVPAPLGCLASALWWLGLISGAAVGRCTGVARTRPGRRPGDAWGTQAGGQRAQPA